MKRESCNRCQRPLPVCLCSSLPVSAIDNHWPLHILQHQQEKGHAINTAQIAVLGLAQCQLHTVTDAPVEDTLPAAVLAELSNAVLIYPGSDSRDVAQITSQELAYRPLLLLDASWRKSRRMLFASPWLQTLPRISFALTSPSRYRIRKEPLANYCSSLEALCVVLGSLEKNFAKYAPLLTTMDVMIEQQIEKMSEATYRRNYLPESRELRESREPYAPEESQDD
ncbi:MAG: tRNA-uridine aminocarboxypropyltransferase [Pseudomonadota bacterium]